MEEKHSSGKGMGFSLHNVIFNRQMSEAVKRAVCVVCCISMMLCPALHRITAAAADGQAAVSFRELNDNGVFLKQSQARVCTLTSSAMMVRRAAMLMGQQDWQLITEQSIRKDAWAEGTGLKWNFTTYGIAVAHKTLSSKEELIQMLDVHPEGIVIYDSRKPHAVLATDYTDGVFYCSDPSNDMPTGRYPIAQASITVESARRCWYVKQPGVTSIDKEADGRDFSNEDLKDEVSGENSADYLGIDGTDRDNMQNNSTGNDGQDEGSDHSDLENKDSKDGDKDGDLDQIVEEPIDDAQDKKYEVSGLIYQILDRVDLTAVCVGQAAADAAVIVPDTVMLEGDEYRVLSISDGAFANAVKLKSITIGKNVQSIGAKSFYRCKKLKSVIINADDLKTIGSDAFAQIHKKVKIYILADQMKEFGKLLVGTSVPGTVVIKINQVSSKKTEKKV